MDLSENEFIGQENIALLDQLNSEQREVVLATEGPILVLAGPGSGKTKAITSRVANIVMSNLADVDEILAVTFTNKAAEEMRERISLLGVGKPSWVLTFHSACLRLLREIAPQVGEKGRFTIIDSDDSKNLLNRIVEELGLELNNFEVKNIIKQVSKVKNDGLSPYDNFTIEDDVFLKVFRRYQDRLNQINAVDFDDILLKTHQLLLNNPRAREIASNKFKYIMIDEFQDTNEVQFKIISLLTKKDGNVCAVGDQDQAIYSFRGSTPEIVNRFSDRFPTRKILFLNINYRSTGNIVSLCKEIISENKKNIRPNIYTENDPGESVIYANCSDDLTEAELVAKEIRTRRGESAILIRTNSQSRIFEQALSKEALPYTVIGGLKFYDRAEIKDMLSYLSLLVNPNDEISFLRVINTPRRGLGAATINNILAVRESFGGDLILSCDFYLSQIKVGSKIAEGIANFLKLVECLKNNMDKPQRALGYLIEEHDILNHYRKDPERFQDRVENMGSLLSGMEQFIANPSYLRPEVEIISDLSPYEQLEIFLESVKIVTGGDSEDSKEQDSKTYIMTIHSSKGKEFDNVFVVGLEEKLLPYQKKDEAMNLDEERRLFFVACSRAKKFLHLSSAKSRILFGNTYQEAPSQFLKNIYGSLFIKDISREVRYGSDKNKYFKKSASNKNSSIKNNHNKSRKDSIEKRDLLPASAKIGDRVKHAVFDEGVIVDIDAENVTIKFFNEDRLFKRKVAPIKLI